MQNHYKSRIKDELDERYSNEGYYALIVLVLIVGLALWASYEASVVVAEWNNLDQLPVNMCLIP